MNWTYKSQYVQKDTPADLMQNKEARITAQTDKEGLDPW